MSQFLFLQVKKGYSVLVVYSNEILIKKLINEVFRWALLFLENALLFSLNLNVFYAIKYRIFFKLAQI